MVTKLGVAGALLALGLGATVADARLSSNRIAFNRIAFNRIAFNRLALNHTASDRAGSKGVATGARRGPGEGSVTRVVAIELGGEAKASDPLRP